MRKKNINTERIEGRIYQHDLAIRTVQNKASANFGKEFISGNLEIATDEMGLNVLQVHFTYVTETTKAGARNNTFITLKKIIEEGKTWVTAGKENATKVKVDNTVMALNDFYTQDGTLVSAKRNEGGFVSIVPDLCKENDRTEFKADTVITNVIVVEPNEERGIKDSYLSVKGYIFNFRNDILPFNFVVKDQRGMQYFESLGATQANPVFTKIWGTINCSTVVIPHEEESAFGEPIVTNSTRTTREWVVTGAAKIPYDFGDENVITEDDLTKALQDREVYLAETKRRSDEYRNNRASTTAQSGFSIPGGNMDIAQGEFNF